MGVFDSAVSAFNKTMSEDEGPSWARGLAGIFPLSALIDFVDIPNKIHIYELTGAIPLWSWPVTPSGSRILLSDQFAQKYCYLDEYGVGMASLALDGRYGDKYTTSSPETVRQCLSSESLHKIANNHQNMSDPAEKLRIQNLEIVRVVRLPGNEKNRAKTKPQGAPWVSFSHGPAMSLRYWTVSISGWALLTGLIIASGILECYVSLGFLVAVPATGLVISALFGSRPRKLLVDTHSAYNRLVLVTKHTNHTDWIVFYGESTIVNSLLNRPLEPTGGPVPPLIGSILRVLLRVLILGQWGLVIASAALQEWDAFFVTFWLVFCIFSHAYLLPPSVGAKDWMRYNAGIRIERFGTQLSTRRALINTIIALNPDSFRLAPATGNNVDWTKFDRDAMRWVDPILAPGNSRSKWEDATRQAMKEAAEKYENDQLASPTWYDQEGRVLGVEWNETYPKSSNYWKPYILEGIHMAAKIREEAVLPGRTVPKESE
ncbi:peptidase family m3 [Aspergillus terreus]|uniref:Peptidase family m3 n=1 Tax=Aspergillus terreus TaxID=33178 RepID=A0A5M3YMR0_ASPTE|nr:hypothetical protein ATETN484_0001017400 [Aspergillus terreus]GFF13984.1 peptidase family m3 [Aspergillus terreus]